MRLRIARDKVLLPVPATPMIRIKQDLGASRRCAATRLSRERFNDLPRNVRLLRFDLTRQSGVARKAIRQEMKEQAVRALD